MHDFYTLEDPGKRKALLDDDNSEDGNRKRLCLEKRYSFSSKTTDRFLRSWLMMKAMSQGTSFFLFKKKALRDYESLMEDLCLLEQPDEYLEKEWSHFARTLIKTCLSPEYSSVVFGLGHYDAGSIHQMIKDEIELVTLGIPRKFGKEEQFSRLREILWQAYNELID